MQIYFYHLPDNDINFTSRFCSYLMSAVTGSTIIKMPVRKDFFISEVIFRPLYAHNN